MTNSIYICTDVAKGIKLLTLTALLFIYVSPLTFGQKTQEKIPDEFNYFKILQDKEKRLSGKELDTSADNESMKLERFKAFREKRISPKGDIREYGNVMNKYYASRLAAAKGADGCKSTCEDCCFPSNWTYFGPEFTDQIQPQNLGKIGALWVNPNDENNILIGAEGGLWKTTDGGVSWKNITDFCLPGIGITSIAVQPDDNNIIYASTGYANAASQDEHFYGFGLYKTVNGGNSWQPMNIPYGDASQGFSFKVLIHPVLYTNVYALVGSKVFKTIDSGNSWTEVFGSVHNIHNLSLYDLEIETTVSGSNSIDKIYVSSFSRFASWGCNGPLPPDTFIAGDPGGFCSIQYTAKVWKFTLFQNTFTPFDNCVDLTGSLPGFNPVTVLIALSFTSSSKNIACQSNYNWSPTSPPAQIKIYRQATGNPQWINIATTTGSFNYGFSFPFEVSSSNNNVIYYGGLVLNKSINDGNTFSPSWGYSEYESNPQKAGSHPDIRTLVLYRDYPSGNDVLFWGNDGGIGKSSNGGTTTLNLNGKGLQLSQFFGISNSEILPNLIFGGTQDNGIFDNKNQAWRNHPSGDGYSAVSDNGNPLIAYCTVNGSILRTMDGGASWPSVGCPSGASCWNVPMYIDSNNNFFLGSHNLYKKVGVGPWSNVTSISTDDTIVDIELSSNGNIGYIAYNGPVWDHPREKKIYKISNLNSTPAISDLTPGLNGVDWAGITDVATDESGSKLWVCFGGLWEQPNYKVFKYENGSWIEYGQGLPNIPTNAIEYVKHSNELLFLGTDDGVWYRDKDMSQWARYSCNLPDTIVTDLEVNYKSNELRAATYSRGIWKTSINRKIDHLQCSSALTAQANISTVPLPTTYSLINGQTISVNQNQATVDISLKNYCSGVSCCNNVQIVNWKIYKDNLLYQSGSGDRIVFSGMFKSGVWYFPRKYNYRVEIDIICGKDKCNSVVYYFKGQ
jgi:hypothetical protein